MGRALLAALALYGLGVLLLDGDPCDDAGITCRYARNFAAGEGLCFNPGEPVEGYVHFLWILLLGTLTRLTGVEPLVLAPLLGRLAGALAVLTLGVLSRRSLPRPVAPLPPLLLATNPFFLLWAGGGLETPLFAWLLLLTLLWRDHPRRLGFVLWLLCLTRPEGVLAAAVLLPGRRRAWPWFLFPAAAYFLWRWHYFGYILPNVFYAKPRLGLLAGLEYWRRFLVLESPQVVLPLDLERLPLLLGLWTLWRGRGRLRRPFPRRLAVLLVAFAAGILFEGGDWMPGFRFLVPLLPLLFLLLACGLPALGRRAAPAAGVFFAALQAANVLGLALLPPHHERMTWFHQRDYYDDMAAWVRRHVPPGTIVALGDVGYIPYWTPAVRYVDFLGLTDPTIAHLPGGIRNPELYRYLLRRRPQFFLSLVHERPDGTRRGHTPVDTLMLRFLAPDLPPPRRLYERVARVPGWRERGEAVVFYVYRLRE